MKSRVLVIVVILSILMGITTVSGSPVVPTPVPTKETVPAPYLSPTPPGTKSETKITYNHLDHDVLAIELHNRLCMSYSDLDKLSHAELQQLTEQNAGPLGVSIIKARTDANGKFVKDASGKQVYDTISGKGPIATPCSNDYVPPPLNPYPAPGQGTPVPTSTPQATQEPTQAPASSFQPMTIWPVWMPIIMTIGEIDTVTMLMDKAKGYIDRLYQDDGQAGPYGFAKEYMGCPLSIFNNDLPNDYRSVRFVGDYYGLMGPTVGDPVSINIYNDRDMEFVTFEDDYDWQYGEPNLVCEIYHNLDGTTSYHIIKEGWSGAPGNEALYLGDLELFTNVYNTPDNTEAIVNKDVGQAFPSVRYTVRHVGNLAALFYNLNTDPWKVYQLNNVITEYGFDIAPDLYAPLFESGISAADDYMFNDNVYHDCDIFLRGLDRNMSWGYLPYHYPYESKVCLGRQAYIALSRADYLAGALQALHIMQKYNDPDHVYVGPGGNNITPRQEARWIEANGWNGYGIKAFGKDSAYASGVRTFAFLAMESMLGWEYGDTTSQNYANQTIHVVKEVQWGSYPFDTWEGAVADDNGYEQYLFRPIFEGGAMLSWVPGQSWPYRLPPKTVRDDLMDLLGMPQETLLPNVSNGETTLTYWAALRLYLKYRYDISYPT